MPTSLAKACVLVGFIIAFSGAACTVADDSAEVTFHESGRARAVSVDSIRDGVIAIIRDELLRANMVRLLITDSVVAGFRSAGAVEVVFSSGQSLRTGDGKSIRAERILIPLEGTITNGPAGQRLFVVLWGRENYASGPYAAGDAADALQRLHALVQNGP